MPATVEQVESDVPRRRSGFLVRFISTIALWSIALAIAFSGFEELFWLLISAFGLIALWEYYGMLDRAGIPNFKITAMICGALMLAGSFYYFAHMGPARSYDFEIAALVFFSSHDLCQANVRAVASRRTAPDHGLHVVRFALRALAF